MSLVTFLTLVSIAVALGAASFAVSKFAFRITGRTPYTWNGTGLPMGMALGIFYTQGVMLTALAMMLAGLSGLFGAYVLNKLFPFKTAEEA